MYLFNTSSLHFRLVHYVFGDSLFIEKKIDFDESIKSHEIIYKKKPKIVNLCPYCRAVVLSILLLPIAYIYKKFPKKHKEPKPFDIKKSQRNIKIIKLIAITVLSLFGVHQVMVGNYYLAAFHFGIASFQLWGQYFFTYVVKLQKKRAKKKTKIIQTEKTKTPGLFKVYLEAQHDKICPSIAFIDENDKKIWR